MRIQQKCLLVPFLLVLGCAFFIALSSSFAFGAEFRNFEAPSEKLIDRLPNISSQTYRAPQSIPQMQQRQESSPQFPPSQMQHQVTHEIKTIPDSVYLKLKTKFDALKPNDKKKLRENFKTKAMDALQKGNREKHFHYNKLANMLK